MTKIPVLQILPSNPLLRDALESAFDIYPLWEQKDPEAFLDEKGPLFRCLVASVKALVTDALVNKLPNLEIVAANSVGVDNVDIPLLQSRGVALTNTPDVLTDAVAESTVALLLATTRKVVAADRFVRDGSWAKGGTFRLTTQLSNKHVGVVGLGRIGTAIAKRIQVFGSTIGYWGRSAKLQFPAYTFYENLVDLARHCDILIAACSLTKETTKIINREVLDALGPQGFVVNIARGAVIDEAELVKALVEGRIAGAGLDVFENEPHVPEELLRLDTVVLQPHLGPCTVETIRAMAELVVANLEAHFAGKPLPSPFY